jgi:hypothetical protein
MMTRLRERTAIVLWVVIFSFVGLIVIKWGANFSPKRQRGGGTTVGVVNGRKVSLQEFQNALRNAAQRQNRKENRDESQLVGQVWDSLVRDIILKQEMKRLGIQVGDREVAHYTRTQPPPAVRKIEAFQTDGKFDYQKYIRALSDPNTSVVLHAARTIELLGDRARAAVPAMHSARDRAKGNKDPMNMFIRFAADAFLAGR